MDNLCDYGCGQEAKYEQTTGKWCCEPHYNSCPENRRKNSSGLKEAIANGDHPGGNAFGDARAWSKGKTRWSDIRVVGGYDPEKVFVEDSPYNGKVPKRIIIAEKLFEYKCSVCGILSWNDKILILELDHINGVRNDHRLINLRLICPNCHSQTENFRGKKSTGKEKVTESEIVASVMISKNINQVLNRLKLSQNSSNRPRIERVMKKFKLTFG